jgi:predicted PurR-regulated permease PerM
VSESRDDVGEATITLPNERELADRRFYVRLGAVLLLAALGYLVWRIVMPLWQPLLWAVLLGALLAPLNLRLSRRLGNRPRLASTVTTLLAVLLFLLPVAVIAGAVAAQAAQLLGRLNAGAPSMANVVSMDLGHIPWLQQPLAWLGEHTGVTIAQVQGWIVAASKHVLQFLAASSGHVVLGALGTLVSFLLMLFVLFFVLRDGPDLAVKFVRMLPIEERRRARLWQHLAEVTRAVFWASASPPSCRARWSASDSGSPGCPRPSCSAWWPRSSPWCRSLAPRSCGAPARSSSRWQATTATRSSSCCGA